MAAFCDRKLEASNLAATKRKHVSVGLSVISAVKVQKKGKASFQKDNTQNSVT